MSFRILHVLDHSLPLHSGYSFRTASILREQAALGWQTWHLTTPRQIDGHSGHEVADGLTFHRSAVGGGALQRLPVLGRYLAEMQATAARLDEMVRAHQPQVIHAHSPVLTALPALRVARRHGLPVVYEMRALWEDGAVDHGTTQEGSVRYRLSRALETYALKRVQHVTTICEGLRQEIVGRGIPSERVTVIPNAVDATTMAFDPRPDAGFLREHGLLGKTVIGFAGSFYRYEGLELLIEAVAKLAPKWPQLQLLFAGGGPCEPSMRELVERLDLQDRVRFLGRVPHSRIQQVYAAIDVLAYPRMPNRLTEMVTPLKPLEAMAQGRVLVASDVGGHRELIRDGETGFLFRAGDVQALAARLEDVLVAREKWPAVLARALQFVKQERTWTSSVARYRAVYGSLPQSRVGALQALEKGV